MNKFINIDHSTFRASNSEKDRIFQSFTKRVEDFEASIPQQLFLRYELTLNPTDSELSNTDKLKETIYWKFHGYSPETEKSISTLRAKLTLFRFETKGINNLLFSIFPVQKTDTSQHKPQYSPPMTIFDKRTSLLCNYFLYSNSNVFICLEGDNVMGARIFVDSIANKLNRNIITLTINDILRDNTLLKNALSNEKNQVIYLSDFDYLFSDLIGTPKILNRELTMLRNDLFSSLDKKTNTLIISISSALILPNELSNLVDWVENLKDLSSYEIEKYISKEIDNLDSNQINEIQSLLADLPISFIVDEISFVKQQCQYDSQFNVLSYLDSKIKLYKNTRSEFNKVEGADFKIIKPSETLDRVVLSDVNHSKLEMALSSIVNQNLIYNTWGWSEIDPNVRSIINFFGPPGTGKTMCANAIAHELSVKTGFEYQLLSLNYSEIESMYVGEAPKKLERVFKFAKDKRLVLFFDEADSFLGKRIQNVTQGAEQAINSLRSTMLIQLEKYRGVVIFATNLTTNYDAAFKTRFLAEIEFPLPDKPTSIKIFKKNIPSKLYSHIDNHNFSNEEFESIGDALVSLSGRDIKTIIWRVLLKASLKEAANHTFKSPEFIDEALKYKKEKKATEQPINIKGATANITPASQEFAKQIGLNPGNKQNPQ